MLLSKFRPRGQWVWIDKPLSLCWILLMSHLQKLSPILTQWRCSKHPEFHRCVLSACGHIDHSGRPISYKSYRSTRWCTSQTGSWTMHVLLIDIKLGATDLSAGDFTIVSCQSMDATPGPGIPDFYRMVKRPCHDFSTWCIKVQTDNFGCMTKQRM